MLAHLSLMFTAVVVALAHEHHDDHYGYGGYKRSALAAMDIGQAQEICSKDQKLVCCNNSDKCSAIKIGAVKESEALIDHCSSVVICCSIKNKNTIQVGDTKEQCTYAGNLA